MEDTKPSLDQRADSLLNKISADNDEIKQFITANRGKNTEVEILGLKLQVPSVIPKRMRHELAAIQKKGDVEIDEAEQDSYYLLSLFCQNEPYNHKETWEVIDDETGLAMDILGEVMEKAYKTEDKLKRFRGK